MTSSFSHLDRRGLRQKWMLMWNTLWTTLWAPRPSPQKCSTSQSTKHCRVWHSTALPKRSPKTSKNTRMISWSWSLRRSQKMKGKTLKRQSTASTLLWNSNLTTLSSSTGSILAGLRLISWLGSLGRWRMTAWKPRSTRSLSSFTLSWLVLVTSSRNTLSAKSMWRLDSRSFLTAWSSRTFTWSVARSWKRSRSESRKSPRSKLSNKNKNT